MKWIRRLLLAVLALVAILGAVAVLLPRLVDSETLRSMLIVAARSHTGRELTVDGDIHVAVLPRPAVVLPRLALADAKGFGPEPFASIDGARANLRLWPLLRGRLQVASVEIDRPQLRLTRDAAGRPNWAGLLPEPPEDGKPSPARGPGVAAGLAGRVGVGRLQVRGADLLWTDRRSGKWARARDLDVLVTGLDPGRPIPVTASATLDMGDPVRSAKAQLTATLERSGATLWHAKELRLTTTLGGAPLREPLDCRLQAEASFDSAQSRFKLHGMTLEAAPLSLDGEMTVARAEKGPVLGAQLHLRRLDARALAERVGVSLDTADAGALTDVRGSLDIGADAGEVNLARIDLTVDGSQWRGTARLRSFSQPAARFDLEGDHLDLDRYLKPPAVSETAPPGRDGAAQDGEAASVAGSPADALRRLARVDAHGTLQLGRLDLRGVSVEPLALRLRGGQERLVLESVKAGLYGGVVDADAQLDARGRADPRLRLNLTARDVSMAPLLSALTGKDTLHGRFAAEAEVSGIAATGEALLRSLNGTARVSGTDGVLKGINPDRSICLARAALDRARNKAADDCDPSADARFSVLRLGGPIAAGVWRSDDLMVEQARFRADRFYRLTGIGSLDLARGEVDYRLKAASVRRGPGDATPENVRETPVPLRVRGRPGAFKVQPELKEIVRDEALRRLQERLGPAADGVRRKAPAAPLLRESTGH